MDTIKFLDFIIEQEERPDIQTTGHMIHVGDQWSTRDHRQTQWIIPVPCSTDSTVYTQQVMVHPSRLMVV